MPTLAAGRFTIAGLLATAGCCLLLASASYAADEPNGVLRLEGKHIKRLVLNGTHSKTIKDPGSEITLPVGIYTVSEVQLEGDYTCYIYNLPGGSISLDIAEGKVATLRLGAPLTQNVEAVRKGNTLSFSYKLTGIGGESYSESGVRKAPTFTVYQGQTKVGSGTFAYG
jgi:hypothetical protein